MSPIVRKGPNMHRIDALVYQTSIPYPIRADVGFRPRAARRTLSGTECKKRPSSVLAVSEDRKPSQSVVCDCFSLRTLNTLDMALAKKLEACCPGTLANHERLVAREVSVCDDAVNTIVWHSFTSFPYWMFHLQLSCRKGQRSVGGEEIVVLALHNRRALASDHHGFHQASFSLRNRAIDTDSPCKACRTEDDNMLPPSQARRRRSRVGLQQVLQIDQFQQ